MSLSSVSIKRPVLATVMSVVIVVFGIIGYKFLGVRDFPSVDPPIISVSTSYSGANADVIESQITEPLEKSINGLSPIDYNKYLGYAGYKVEDELADKNDAALGITTTTTAAKKIIVTSVQRGTAAYIDGINVNDEITAIDGTPVTDAATMINGKNPGDKIEVTVTRDGQAMTLPVTLLKSNRIKYNIVPVDSPTEQQLTVRKKWLSI